MDNKQHIPCSKLDLSMVSGIWKQETDANGKTYNIRETAKFNPDKSLATRQDSYTL